MNSQNYSIGGSHVVRNSKFGALIPSSFAISRLIARHYSFTDRDDVLRRDSILNERD